MRNFSDSNGRTYSCVLLNGKNSYKIWAFTMEQHLATLKLLDVIKDANDDAKQEDDWMAREQQTKSILLSVMEPDEVAKIIHCSTAKEI